MGFGQATPIKEDLVIQVTDEDLEAYGFIPEFCSRIGHIVVLASLSRDDMRRVLLDVEGAPIPAAMRVAEQYGFLLRFDDSAVEAMISQAISTGQGARKLASLVDRCTLQAFHDLPPRVARRKTAPVVTISSDTVDDPLKFHVR